MNKWPRPQLKLYLILENIRSLFNVGALFRSADGAGVSEILLVGYSGVEINPITGSVRLHPHIHKTDMGTSQLVKWSHFDSIKSAVDYIRQKNPTPIIASLEQSAKSQNLICFQPGKEAVALILGNEIMGVSQQALDLSDVILEIPQWGQHNSLNVAVAGSIGLYLLLTNIYKGGSK